MSKKNKLIADEDLDKMVNTHLSLKKKSQSAQNSQPSTLESSDGLNNPNPTLDKSRVGFEDLFNSQSQEEFIGKDNAERIKREVATGATEPTEMFPVDLQLGNGSKSDIGYRGTGLKAGIEENANGPYVSPLEKSQRERLADMADVYKRVNGKNIEVSNDRTNGTITQGKDKTLSDKVGRYLPTLGELENSFASGVDAIGVMAGSLPAAAVDLLAKRPGTEGIFNILGKALKGNTGNGEGIVSKYATFMQKLASGETDAEEIGQIVEQSVGLPEEYNPLSPNNAVVQEYAKRMEENSNLAYKNYNGGISKAIADGNIANAGRLASLGVIQSLPIMLGLAATRGAGVSNLGSLGIMGLGTAGQEYRDLKAENPEMDKNILYANAFITGLSEAGTELLGTNLIYDQAQRLLKRGARKEAEEVLRTGIRGYIDGAFKKAFVGVAAFDEGSTEAVNQIVKNAMDKWTGVKPDIDYIDGALDAFIVGVGAGAAFSAPFHAASKVSSLADKKTVRSLVSQVSSINQYLRSPNISPAVREKLFTEVANTNEQINDIYEKDQVEAQKLTPSQKSRVAKINEEIDNKESIIGDPDMPNAVKESAKEAVATLEQQSDEVVKEAQARVDDLDNASKKVKLATSPEQLQKTILDVEQYKDEALDTPEFQNVVELAQSKVSDLKKVKPSENEDTKVKDALLKELEDELDGMKVKVPEVRPTIAAVEEVITPKEEVKKTDTESNLGISFKDYLVDAFNSIDNQVAGIQSGGGKIESQNIASDINGYNLSNDFFSIIITTPNSPEGKLLIYKKGYGSPVATSPIVNGNYSLMPDNVLKNQLIDRNIPTTVENVKSAFEEATSAIKKQSSPAFSPKEQPKAVEEVKPIENENIQSVPKTENVEVEKAQVNEEVKAPEPEVKESNQVKEKKEQISYQSKKPTSQDVYARGKDGFVKVKDSKKVNIASNLDFFVHPALENGGFNVTEAQSGFSMGIGGDTAAEAVKNAKAKVDEYVNANGLDAFYKLINTQVGKMGMSPRYDAVAEAKSTATSPTEEVKGIEKVKPKKTDLYLPNINLNGKAYEHKSFEEGRSMFQLEDKGNGEYNLYTIDKNNPNFVGANRLTDILPLFNEKSPYNMQGELKKIDTVKPAVVKIEDGKLKLVSKGEVVYDDNYEYANRKTDKPTIAEIAKESPNVMIVKPTPDVEQPKPTTKEKIEKVDDEIDAAFKDFAKALGKTLNSNGINSEAIEKGIKLVGLYAKKGVYKFTDMIDDAYERFGDQFKDVVAGFKAAYSSFYSQADDAVADQMTDPREVRTFNINEYLKPIENERGSEPNTLETDTRGVSEGQQPEQAGGIAPVEQIETVSGAQDDGSGEIGNEADQGQQAVATGDRGRSDAVNSDTIGGIDGENTAVNTRKSVPSDNTSRKKLKPADQNHAIAPDDVIVPTGAVGKFNANADAIFMLAKLEAENRNPTPEEKKVLAQYVGWGGLSKYLEVPQNSDADVIDAYMNGKSVMVYKNNSWTKTQVDFTPNGPIDLSKFDSVAELVADIRKELAREGYSISPENVRGPMLKAMLTPEEYRSAQNSTISAHFTDRRVVDGLWNIAERLGFKGGKVLESSAGIGNIFGLMPENMRDRTSLNAYELDSLTGRMLSKLYPQANIIVDGFENSKVPVNSVDLAITNVPFGAKAPYDRLYPDLSKFSLHNYFIAKNIKMLKPGGIAIMISSASTMDANISAKFREWVTSPSGGNSYLVGAIRLPNNAFAENAGTEVTADVLVFQKKGDNVDTSLEQPFRYTKFLKEGLDRNDDVVKIDVNEYFIDNPQQMLGEMMTSTEAGSGGLYGNGAAPTLKAPDGFNMVAALNDAVNNLPVNILENNNPTSAQLAVQEETVDAIDKKEGSLFSKNGKTYKVENGSGVEQKLDTANKTKQAADYTGIKSDLLDLVKLEQQELADEGAIDLLRKNLNDKYDAYVKKYGNINGRSSNFLDELDIDFPIVASIENISRSIEKVNGKEKIVQEISKGDILKKRINFPRVEPTTATDIKDAIDISLNYKNNINVNYIAKLLGETPEVIENRLLDEDLAYKNPDTGLLEAPDEYLSGYVRDKLKSAEIALLNDKNYAKNVNELKKVIPQDIPSSLISYSLGSAWIPSSVYEEFANQIFEKSDGGKGVSINFLDNAGKFTVDGTWMKYKATVTNTYAAGGKDGIEILNATLNNQQIIVNDTVVDAEGKKKTVKNPEKTAAAQAMQAQMQEEFEEFIRSNEPAQIQTERIYNDIFNGQVLRDYRIPAFEHYPGASTSITLRQHQKRAVARGLSESTLNAHEVGSGKTFTIITTAMEMRRLGTAKKPLIAVQNSTRGQFVTSFRKLYPGAKILAPTDKELQSDGRRRLFAKIATGDWDAVILPQSQLSMIPDDPIRQQAYILEQIDEMRNALLGMDKYSDRIGYNAMEREIKALTEDFNKLGAGESVAKKKGGKSEVKRMADKSASITADMSKVLDRKTDDIFNFEDMGIDAFLVDEAHAFKRLGFQTQMKNIKGIDTSKSQRSQSVLLKARWVQEKTGGKNVLFYTGTPISNTMAEAWTMLKYVRPDILEHLGIQYFDQFAKTFGQVIPSLEQTGGGTFKVQNRFAKFQNLPEFITAFRAATDVVLSEDVKEFQENNTLPKLKDGKITQVVIPQSPELKAQIGKFRETLLWFEKLTGKEKKENSHIPLVIFGKATQAAIDLRLLDPTNVDSPDSKVNTAIKNALEVYKNTSARKGVQMIFSDRYQSPEPKDRYLDEDETIVNPAFGKDRFNLFQDIKKKLMANGVPESEIVILTDPKYDKSERKEAIFDDANSGKIRFLLGSTERMGVGVNAQEKMVGLHHLDAPLRPMDFAQRNGRIIRQGNENEEVEVFAYGVEKTLDSSAFQRLSTKQKFINQVMKGEGLERVTEDPADEVQMTFDEMMAQLSDSPFAMQKLLVDNKVRSERTKMQNFNAKKTKNTYDYRDTKSMLAREKSALVDHKKYAEIVKEKFQDGNITEVTASNVTSTEKFGDAVEVYLDMLFDKFSNSPTNYAKGAIQINGVQVELQYVGKEEISKQTSLLVYKPELYYSVPSLGILDDGWGSKGIEVRSNSGNGLLSSLRSKLSNVLEQPAKTEKRIAADEVNLATLEKAADAVFDDTRLKELEAESESLKEKMLADDNKNDDDPNGGGVNQSDAEYIIDQSNVAPILDGLDKLKIKGNQTFSLIVPIPPIVWNGAIEVMKAVVKATNSTQKAIRVAARYIINQGGSKAQAQDFTQVMNDNYGPNSEYGKKISTIAEKITKAKESLKERVADIESDMTDIKKVKSKLVGLMSDARKSQLVKQGIAKSDNAANAIQAVAGITDAANALTAIDAVKAFLENVGYNNSLRHATNAFNRLSAIERNNKMILTPTTRNLAALNPKTLTPEELDQYLELAPVLVSQLDGKDPGLIADNEIALFIEAVNNRMDEEVKAKLMARYPKLGMNNGMSIEEMKALINETKEEKAEKEQTLLPEEFASRESKKREILKTVLDINLEELSKKDDIPSDKKFMVDGLKSIDVDMMSTGDIRRINQVVANIVYNNKYTGAGYFSKIAQGIGQIKSYASLVSKLGGGFRPITFDNWLKDKVKGSNLKSLSLTDKFLHLNNYEEIGKATDNMLAHGIGNGYSRQKDEMKTTMDALDKVIKDNGLKNDKKGIYRVGIFGELNAYIVGDKRSREQQFFDNKMLFKQSMDILQDSRDSHEKGVYKLLAEIWEDIDGLGSTADLQGFLSPEEQKVYDFIQSIGQKNFNRLYDNNEMYGDAPMKEKANYVHRRYQSLRNGEKEVDIISDDPILASANGVLGQSGTKSDVIVQKALPKDKYIDYNIYKSFKIGLNHTLNDVYTLGDRIKTNFIVNSPKFAEIIKQDNTAGKRNLNIIKDSIKQMVNLQRGVAKLDMDMYGGAAKVMNFFRQTFYSSAVGSLTSALPQYLSSAAFTLSKLNKPSSYIQSLYLFTNDTQKAKDLILLAGSGTSNRDLQGDNQLNDAMENFTENVMGSYISPKISEIMDGMNEFFFKSLKTGDRLTSLHTWMAGYVDSLLDQGIIKSASEFTPEMLQEHLVSPNEMAATSAETLVTMSNNESDSSRRADRFVTSGLKAELWNDMAYPVKKFAVAMNNKLWLGIRNVTEWDGGQREGAKTIVGALASIAIFNAIRDYLINTYVFDLSANLIKSSLGLGDEEEEERLRLKMTPEQYEKYKSDKRLTSFGLETISDTLFGGQNVFVEKGIKNAINFAWKNWGDEIQKEAKEKKEYAPRSLFYVKDGLSSMTGIYGNFTGLFLDINSDEKSPLNVLVDISEEDSDSDAKTRRAIFSVGMPLATQFIIPSADLQRINNRIKKRVERVDEKYIDINLQDKKSKDYKKHHGGGSSKGI